MIKGELSQIFCLGGHTTPGYRLGKIRSKYIIIECLTYASKTDGVIETLYKGSRLMRRLLGLHYRTVLNICKREVISNLNMQSVGDLQSYRQLAKVKYFQVDTLEFHYFEESDKFKLLFDRDLLPFLFMLASCKRSSLIHSIESNLVILDSYCVQLFKMLSMATIYLHPRFKFLSRPSINRL